MDKKEGKKDSSKTQAAYSSKPKLTKGQMIADKVTIFAGSWTFIISFVVFLIIWMITNTHLLINGWDPYPFILLNLVLSCLAALQAPIILMSQNRAAERDRAKAERDYYVNRKAEREIEDMQKDLDEIKKMIHTLYRSQINNLY
jgi:uncharacterized membrane protein